MGAFCSDSQRAEIVRLQLDSVTTHELVPSVVTYKKGQRYPTDIGVGPKRQLIEGTVDPESVIIRSVKLQMGKEKVSEAPWLSPEQVSAAILGLLKDEAERTVYDKQADVVIGVPACFGTDEWEATKRAAELAGFTNVTLIDEPKAALLDFIQAQERLAPESRVLDFGAPRTICVFDPGGGTVDVSVVQVQQTPVNRGGKIVYEMRYEDLGLARNLSLGGDNFDKLLVDHLKNKFALQTGIQIDEISDAIFRGLAQGKILQYAEHAKKYLADEVMKSVRFRGISEKEAIDHVFVDLAITHLYKSYTLNYHLTYSEYISVVSPLLGQSLNLRDLEGSDAQRILEYHGDSQKSDNIIFPIYDALLKAKEKIGSLPVIDAVLISGGMSKLQVLRLRLREFFGPRTPIIEVPSPDLSVARGAAIHHYNLVHGLDRTSSVLPEAISMEAGGTFVRLVPANTEYPTVSPIKPKGLQFFIPSSGILFIDVPLWRGDPPRPTAKLIDRRIDLRDKSKFLKEGDLVDIQISIDANRHLRLEAWLNRDPSIRFDVVTTAT